MAGPFARLSPRRRWLAVGVTVLLTTGLVALAVRLAASRTTQGEPPAQDRPGPVILMPGYGGGTSGLRTLAERLRQAGRTAIVVDPPEGGTGDLADQARALDHEVGRALRAGAPSVDVVGYSAGGVVARLWAHDHDGAGKARRIVTLGSPHGGTDLAAAGSALAPGACPTACRQLAPGSPIFTRLGARVAAPPSWISIWTTLDETVTPPETARLTGALNIPVQTVCASARTTHSQLPADPQVTALVLAVLGTAPPQPPATCPAG